MNVSIINQLGFVLLMWLGSLLKGTNIKVFLSRMTLNAPGEHFIYICDYLCPGVMNSFCRRSGSLPGGKSTGCPERTVDGGIV